jgi:DNA-binding GntR family transcriptional regulator
MWRATYEQLAAAERLDTPLGQLALQHAAILDDPRRGDTGSARAALSKEYRAAFAEAMHDAETERDELDDILESANVKRLPGGTG